MRIRAIALLTAALALGAVPALAKNGADDGPNHDAGDDHGDASNRQDDGTRLKQYVFRGVYQADGSVNVTKGNGRVKKAGLVGENVVFDFSSARVDVDDDNADGEENIADVADGDEVDVKARLAKRNPGPQPFTATRLKERHS
jgi:hypothetical protein